MIDLSKKVFTLVCGRMYMMYLWMKLFFMSKYVDFLEAVRRNNI